ncbi:hypothetical protein CA3LBN_003826 [Candidozyma haemuli]|uniref:non-specific serine/threonine protein kinase n=1 Tax=Candidozyma haemuli TaxID=45357 RepID=A0ABX8IDH2_9ASCO|nr:hypothetical protein CA3LBN_003826 [[Candida] haemuloni]
MDLLFSVLTKCLPCFPDLSSPSLTVNGTKYKILRLLGEGGFSYVYLVSQKNNANNLYAMKKIRCPYGGNDATYANAWREVRSYHRFAESKTPYIIHTIDESVVNESDGSRTFYILLPYFERSLQDVINFNVLNSVSMEEEEVLKIFIGVLRGVQAMHKYQKRGSAGGPETDDDENDLMLPDEDDDSYGQATELSELCPYAHRDIKPANVMLSAEGLPVLVDLGSCSKARVTVTSRQQALTLTEFAQEHCTLPYRAPELLDVASNAEITESTDIWSLGGELMEGWNDCPDIMMQANTSSGSVGSRSKRRTPRAYGSANSSQSSVATSNVAPVKEYTEEELRQVKSSIETYVSEGQFKEEDKAFVNERLLGSFDSLEDGHKQFVARTAEAVISHQKKPGQLKTEVLTFMMANSGVSTWAVGLKKFVEMQ